LLGIRASDFICRIHDYLTRLSAILAAIGLISIVVFYVYEVITRYVFDSPTAWVSDFVSYTLCISVFLALPKVTQDRAHVAVTILVGVYFIIGPAGFPMFANSILDTVSITSLASIPLFILMGEILFRSGTMDVLFDSTTEQLMAVLKTLPFMTVIFSVMGFIMLGIATPSESAATGVVG